jgi:hypothetical protein
VFPEAPNSGFMGAQPRLFTSSGTLCKSLSQMAYDYGPDMYTPIYKNGNCGTKYFYSYGFAAAYNGNGYDMYHTNRSPNLWLAP